nr:flagellar M-ring protein FliF [Actinomycetota bacterium]
SIEGMDPEQVTVADAAGTVLSAPGQGVTAAAGDARSQMEQDYEDRLAANAEAILARVLGPGRAEVSVRADLDLNQRSTTSETHTYEEGTPPISESTTTEEFTGTGAAVGGILGPENQADAGAGNGDSQYNKESTTSNNAVGTTVETVEAAPGAINRLTVSVVMDEAIAGNLNQAQIQDLVGNAVGLDVARGDDITVASMAFDTTAADRAAEELVAAEEAERQAQLWSMVRTGGIALGIALLVLVVWLRSRRGREDDDEEDYAALELADDVMAELDRIRIESTRAMPVVDNAALELEAAERARVRGEIASMVSEKPDEVAAMLRGWLSESGAKS